MWKAQEYCQTDAELASRENQSLRRRDSTSRKWAKASAFDMRIEITVPEIVYRTPCTTHNKSSDPKKSGVGYDDVWRAYGSGERGGEEGTEETGKE